ncbi:type I restriction-modification system subunit M [Amycolatopsis taiwanensis]|uniref:site-specific DNA-methyltransferase (adenine-specific) n=1 Tax=Amycolatopsis taiwanensis TaxID=342230 RepID=A0A9W6VER8_9PSEU|nr:class I SAM-dependent DNA methyltransferase [Amycolatopsis taiwanensis]GLY64747.1 type I restriction-modification system subunit M [Amycolatopsis taiwanensis]
MRRISAADLTEHILKAADLLRGKMDAADYSHVISAILLLKWASDQHWQLEVPEPARWNHIMESTYRSPDEALNEALAALSKSNRPVLDELFWDLDFTRRLSHTEAQQLIWHFNAISLKVEDLKFDDVVDRAYDQALGAFADAAGKKGGEFYTPRSVIELMVRLADPRPGQSVCDPCAGSGGMLTGAEQYVAEHTGRRGELALFGQDVNAATCATARLNLLFHRIRGASLRCGDTLANPLHVTDDGRLRRFDRILTNPPFSLQYQRQEVRFSERMRYGWTSKSDLMFVQHVLATLAPDGLGVVVAPQGALFRGGAEAEIRRGIVQDDRLEAVIGIGPNVFHGTSVPACLLVLRGLNGAHAQKRGVLFINAEHEITTGRSRNYLAPRHVEKIAATFHAWREIPHFSRIVSIEEIGSSDFNLNVRRYVDPAPAVRMRLNSHSLLFGGVPRADVEAQRDRFRAFGIEVTDLFDLHEPSQLMFPPCGYEATAEKIPPLAESSENEFLSRVRGWLESERPAAINFDARMLPVARRHLMESFLKNLLPAAILDEHQLGGVFADWWADQYDSLRELNRIGLSQDAGHLEGKLHGRILELIEENLTARIKNIVALERQKLVDIYRSWGDRYGTSLLDLEKRRETAEARLRSRLRALGYPWPCEQ